MRKKKELLRTTTRERLMRRIWLSLCCLAVLHAVAGTRQPEAISGTIVAYSNGGFPVCLNGHSEWSILIHVKDAKATRSQFIRVNFSLRCSQSFESVIGEPPRREFHLIRDPRNDQVLEEFITLREKDMSTGRIREVRRTVWKRLPGMEQEKLPFGQIVHSYQDPALPLLPIL